jgi:hypothetical protein
MAGRNRDGAFPNCGAAHGEVWPGSILPLVLPLDGRPPAAAPPSLRRHRVAALQMLLRYRAPAEVYRAGTTPSSLT